MVMGVSAHVAFQALLNLKGLFWEDDLNAPSSGYVESCEDQSIQA